MDALTSNPALVVLLIVIVLMFVVVFLRRVFQAITAEGWEDEYGFHYGKKG